PPPPPPPTASASAATPTTMPTIRPVLILCPPGHATSSDAISAYGTRTSLPTSASSSTDVTVNLRDCPLVVFTATESPTLTAGCAPPLPECVSATGCIDAQPVVRKVVMATSAIARRQM